MSTDWQPERIAALIALWNDGVPTSEIGRRLGVTKNAVVGKAHRLGLAKRPSPIQGTTKPRPAKAVTLGTLSTGMCSWPEGEPGTEEFRFCGRPVVPGKPYCAEHCARAYVKIGKEAKEKEAAAA